MKNSFIIFEVLQETWATVKKYASVVLGILGIIALFSYLPVFLIALLEPNQNQPTIISLFLILIFLPIQIIVKFGFVKASLQMGSGKPARINDIFSQATFVYKYILAWILYGCIVVGGLVLLIVPGVIWAARFNLFPYLLADNPNMSIFESLQQSYELTRGYTATLVKFWIFFVGLEIASMVVIFIGPLIATCIITIATAHIFRRLNIRHKAT